MNGLEHQHQVALFKWVGLAKSKIPELDLLFAIPNGGKRNKRVAWKLKQEGVKSGVSDLFLPVATSGFHGLWIEMKSGRNQLTKNQQKWRDSMIDGGYDFHCCYSWSDARGIILFYLGIATDL